jgi:hypothetical protein
MWHKRDAQIITAGSKLFLCAKLWPCRNMWLEFQTLILHRGTLNAWQTRRKFELSEAYIALCIYVYIYIWEFISALRSHDQSCVHKSISLTGKRVILVLYVVYRLQDVNRRSDVLCALLSQLQQEITVSFYFLIVMIYWLKITRYYFAAFSILFSFI